jgi:hypothetical protein
MSLYSSDQEFNDFYALWQLEHHSPTWPLYKSPEAETLVRNAAFNISGSQISISHFIIAFDALVADGTLKQLRSPKPVANLFTLTAAEYHGMSSDEVRRRRHDPDFVQAVEALISAGQI